MGKKNQTGEIVTIIVLQILESSGNKKLKTKSMVDRFKNEETAKGLTLYWDSQ